MVEVLNHSAVCSNVRAGGSQLAGGVYHTMLRSGSWPIVTADQELMQSEKTQLFN